MILEKMMDVGVWILTAVMDLLDVLPDFPSELVAALNSFFDLIFDNMSLLGFFLPLTTVKILIPLMLVVINFEHIYAFIMWVIRKIPVLGIK